MPDQVKTIKPPRKRRLLNPRRVQSLLKRLHETMLADSKNPALTAKEKLEYLKAGAEYTKALSAAEGHRRSDEKRKVEQKKKATMWDGF
jgi:hypothetical protein